MKNHESDSATVGTRRDAELSAATARKSGPPAANASVRPTPDTEAPPTGEPEIESTGPTVERASTAPLRP